VVIVVPPPQPSGDTGAVAGGSPSAGLRTTYKVVVSKVDREEKDTLELECGDMLRLDEDEKMEATSGGIAFIVMMYDVVSESQDH
jgi:hypothetical protein